LENTNNINMYDANYRRLQKRLEELYGKSEVFLTSQFAKYSGSNPDTAKRFIARMHQEHHLKHFDAWARGCPKDRLLLFSTVIGNAAVCGHCNRELQYPNDNVETVICPFCGAVYPQEQWHVPEKDVCTYLTELNYYANKTLLEDVRVILEGIPQVIGSWFTWLQGELSKLPFGNP